MKKILLISHFTQSFGEVGNNRFIYIIKLLVDNGYEVELVTTDFSHKNKAPRLLLEEQYKNLPYKFTMVHEPGYKSNVSLKRISSHKLFGKNLKIHHFYWCSWSCNCTSYSILL